MTRSALPKILLILVVLLVTFKTAFSESDFRTFLSPVDELERIQEQCEAQQVTGFDITKEAYRSCIDASNQTIPPMADCSNVLDPCWKNITTKIDECAAGRGKTVEALYITFRQQFFCNKNFTSQLQNLSKFCAANNSTTKPCTDVTSMTSPDLCTSFKAQKLCAESDLRPCNHTEHRDLLLKHFNYLTLSLGCDDKKIDDHPDDTGGDKGGSDISPTVMKIVCLAILVFIFILVLLKCK